MFPLPAKGESTYGICRWQYETISALHTAACATLQMNLLSKFPFKANQSLIIDFGPCEKRWGWFSPFSAFFFFFFWCFSVLWQDRSSQRDSGSQFNWWDQTSAVLSLAVTELLGEPGHRVNQDTALSICVALIIIECLGKQPELEHYKNPDNFYPQWWWSKFLCSFQY